MNIIGKIERTIEAYIQYLPSVKGILKRKQTSIKRIDVCIVCSNNIVNKSLCKDNHYYYSYNIRLGILIWKVIISRLPAASLLTSGGTRRQRLHEFPKWSPGFCDSPAFVLPKFGLNFSQIKAAVLQNQPLPVGLPRILHICLCILLDYIVKKILNRISSRPNSFWLTLQR